MASGPIVEDDGTREKQKYIEIKVYTRKALKGPQKNTTTAATNYISSITAAANDENNNSNAAANNEDINNTTAATKDDEVNNNNLEEPPAQTLGLGGTNLVQQQLISRFDAAISEDSSSLNREQQGVVASTPNDTEVPKGNGAVEPGLENSGKMNMALRSKQEKRELRRKLEGELDMVRILMKRIEAKEEQISGFSNLRASAAAAAVNDGVHNGGGRVLMRVHSEVGSVSVPREVTRPLHKLRVSILDNNHHVGSESVEKEKRTPKANPLYRNSEFLLANDKFPPAETHKKSKSSGKKQGGSGLGIGFGMGSKFFKTCSTLLERLMKHKHGWVFNAPVDAKALGLHDYFIIIKHPMDLGTVKSRLNRNWYKSPKEFAEDVRLTFSNAMTYNPPGQDVHVMAEQLSQIFEDRWAIIEFDYTHEMRFGLDYEVSLPTPTSRLAPPPRPPPLDLRRIMDRSDSIMTPMDPKPKPMSITTPSSRTPAPKKPKAKDLHKRDMTFDEKQKLSTNLQSLPSEKLDNIVQIIKKRNSSLFQQDDEIEVDIDGVDAETLWELDRFVTNYKKCLSKNKRKAELAMQARAAGQQNVLDKASAPVVAEVPKHSRTEDKHVSPSSPVQGEQRDNATGSSSSSSSSSDSGSSSSDSDSDSSSASGSDADHSLRT